MIWVLLQSESQWQRNNAITFFILSLCFSVPGVFLRNHLREFVLAIMPQLWQSFNKFYYLRYIVIRQKQNFLSAN